MSGSVDMHAPAPRGIDELAARHRQQPRFGILRNAAGWPLEQRDRERVRQRVLSPGDVARARGEKRNQAAVALPGYGFRGLADTHATFSRRMRVYKGQIGRTSTEPRLALGHRAAHTRAVSRSGTSMT